MERTVVVICVFMYMVQTCTSVPRVSYEGHKVFRIIPENAKHLNFLTNLQSDPKYDVWREAVDVGSPVDVRVPPQFLNGFLQQLNTINLNYGVMVEDVEVLIARGDHTHRNHDDSRYYNLTEVHDYLDEMVTLCGDECSTAVIGQSYEGRDMKIIQIGRTGATNRSSIWIDCGIHAREWITPATCQYIIDKLITEAINDSTTAWLREQFVWHVLPVLNVDGYDYTWSTDRMWRKTRKPNNGSDCVGTDGNRNFDLGFGGVGSSDEPCSQTYKGTAAFSEPETAALNDFVKPRGDEFVLALTIHSYGQFFVYPWGYTTEEDPENSDDLARVAEVGEAAINAVHDMGYVGRRSNGDMAGNTIDWARGSCGIPYAYLFELRDTGEHGFLLPPEFIQPTGQEIWAGVQAMVLEIAEIEGITWG